MRHQRKLISAQFDSYNRIMAECTDRETAERYMERKVLGKTVCENYKTKSSRKTAPEEQYTFEGAIPAIVDVETWQTVQKIRETVRRAPKRQNAPNRLTGLLYCVDCGSKLTHRYNLVQGKWVEDAFICSGYRHLIHDCTMHHIPTVKIEAAILAVIQRVSWYVRHNEKEFIERVREASDQNQEKTVKECKQKINKAQKRHKELDGLVKKLYEGNATGKIPDKHFTRLLATPAEVEEQRRQQEEQAAKEARSKELKKARYEKRKAKKREFTARKKAGLLTPEELEAEEKRLAHSREWQKEWREKRKAAEPPKPPKKKSIKELMELEKTGAELTPEETEWLAEHRRKKAAQHKAWRERQKAGQPKARTLKELAAAQKEGKALTPEESERLEAHKSRKKIAREKLVQQAATDPAAAAELAKKRAHQSQATKKSRQKIYEEAATGNPEAVERYENYLVTRRESYHRKKQEAERTA